MPPEIEEKITNFLMSDEVIEWARDLAAFLGLNTDSPEDVGPCLAFFASWLYSGEKDISLKNLIQQHFQIEDENKLEEIYQFLLQKYLPQIEKLYQTEEKTEEIQEKISFEEKEKRYLELMKQIVQNPVEERQIPQTWKEIERKYKYRTFGFGSKPSQEDKKESFEIIIKKKQEEEEKKKEENFLDLSGF